MANGIEFTSRVGKSFTAWVIKSSSYVNIETGSTVVEVSPGRYRVDTVADSGKVWFEATAGPTKVYGWADLDNPGANGFADVVDSLSGGSAEIIEKLDAIKGPGNRSWSIAVRTTGAVPISGCECWVASDSAGNNVLTDIQRTDAKGVVEFLLDPGTYYLFRRKAGVTFTNPQSFTVT
jgi:hypothetical protein